MSDIIGDTYCPECRKHGHDRTGNHLILFSNGAAFCNRCGYKEPADTFTKPTTNITNTKTPEQIESEIEWIHDNSKAGALPSRALGMHALSHYGVRVGYSMEDGRTPVCYYLPIHTSQGLSGYKVKTFDKQMWIKGSGKDALFFGANVVPSTGRMLFITEGQEDAVALYQAMCEFGKKEFRHRIAVVSLQNGAGSAANEIVRNKILVDNYAKIVLCFDMDDAGRDGVEKVLTVLPREKVLVARYPLKDANEMIKAGEGKELFFSVIKPNKPKPEKIISGNDISKEELRQPLKPGIKSIYPVLNQKLHGFRYGDGGGELTIFCSGTGMGKTTAAREIMYDFNKNHQLRLGHIFLEEQFRKTGQAYIALDNNVPLAAYRENPAIVADADFDRSYDSLIHNNRCYFMKHWGSLESAELMDHMYYFSKVEGCDFIMLDHISLVVSGNTSSSEGERKDLDILMTKLAAFTEESGTSVIAIVHLKRPDHGSFNEGSRISLRHLRGSSAIEQLAHNVIAIEGDQASSTPNQRLLRILKAREWGEIGEADDLEYSHDTGRLLPLMCGLGG